MNLNQLISEFNSSELKLREVILCDGDEDQLRPWDTATQDLLEAIREHKPEGFGDLRTKLNFFLGRLKTDIANVSDTFALEALIHILEKDFALAVSSDPLSSMLDAGEVNTTGVVTIKSAHELLSKTEDRISILDKNYRYVGTSQVNGKFYGQHSHEIVGKHVGDVIGATRFSGRAKRFLDGCYSGKRQDYFHKQTIGGKDRIMSCQMMPLINDDSSLFGAMVKMRDITGFVSRLDSIVLQKLD